MNMINLVGRLTRDPELKEIGGGRSVCELRLAGSALAVAPARWCLGLH